MNYVKLDKDKCVACRLCELICSVHHTEEFNPKKTRIKVDIEFPLPGKAVVCRQCKNPRCVEACPAAALVREDDYIKYFDEECIECSKCIEACPFDAIFNDGSGHGVLKCDLCEGQPQCIEYCPRNALNYQKGEE